MLETAARFLFQWRSGQLCSSLCSKGIEASKSFRVSGEACFAPRGPLCSFMLYCTREYLERTLEKKFLARSGTEKISTLLVLTPRCLRKVLVSLGFPWAACRSAPHSRPQ